MRSPPSARVRMRVFPSTLLPIIPPDAQLSPRSSVQAHHRGKVPGLYRATTGEWTGFPEWTKLSTTEKDIDTWSNWRGVGVGIRTGQVIGLDIDVTVSAWADACEKAALDMLGSAPCRIGNPPKRLLPYRMAEAVRKQSTEWTDPHTGEKKFLVEILAGGDQFVAIAQHPKTRRPYAWSRGNLVEITFDGLTEVTPDQLCAYLAEVDRLAAGYGLSRQRKQSTSAMEMARSTERRPIGDPSLMGDPEMIEDALTVRDAWKRQELASVPYIKEPMTKEDRDAAEPKGRLT